MINYILANNRHRSRVADVKAIPGEEVVSQHCVLVMDVLFSKDVKRKNKFKKEMSQVKVMSQRKIRW